MADAEDAGGLLVDALREASASSLGVGARAFLRRQHAQEQRHARDFALVAGGMRPRRPDPELRGLVTGAMACIARGAGVALLHAVLEPVALAEIELVCEEWYRLPTLARILTGVLRDERAHVRFGRAWLSRHRASAAADRLLARWSVALLEWSTPAAAALPQGLLARRAARLPGIVAGIAMPLRRAGFTRTAESIGGALR